MPGDNEYAVFNNEPGIGTLADLASDQVIPHFSLLFLKT